MSTHIIQIIQIFLHLRAKLTLAFSQTPLKQDLSNFAWYDLVWGLHWHFRFYDLVSNSQMCLKHKLQIACFEFNWNLFYLSDKCVLRWLVSLKVKCTINISNNMESNARRSTHPRACMHIQTHTYTHTHAHTHTQTHTHTHTGTSTPWET